MRIWKRLAVVTGAALASSWAQAATLTAIEVGPTRSGAPVELNLRFDGPAPQPSSFALESPARISIDLPQTDVGLAQPQRSVKQGVVDSYIVLETEARTRVVLSLSELTPHALERRGNNIVATIQPAISTPGAQSRAELPAARIEDIDFRRSETGAGQIQISLSTAQASVDVRDEGGLVVAEFFNTELDTPAQKLDVLDFATPVSQVTVSTQGPSARVAIRPVANADFERVAYQVGKTFTVELAPLTPDEIARRAREEPEYSGERINFSFQDIELRALLQIIADVAGKNLVVSDSVVGELTLRLENVPWDQALDIVLRTKGLTKSIEGDVMWIAPTQEVAANEKEQLQAMQQRMELAPLVTEVIQVNYANAVDLAELLASESGAFLSDRGRVNVDERTSVLIVQDTRERLADIRLLVRQLDIPVRQVLIEARIVIANDDFSRSLGVRAGVTGGESAGDTIIGIAAGGSQQAYATALTSGQGGQGGQQQQQGGGGAESLRGSLAPFIVDSIRRGQQIPITGPQFLPNIDFPASAPGLNPSNIALSVLSGDFLLDLELSAVQAEGKGEVISSPRVMTSNGMEAYIEQGEEIPFNSATATQNQVQFKKAVLSLRVTPQITPDDKIIMQLQVTRDARGQLTPQSGGGLAVGIDTRRLNTQVLVGNGETLVLGGIYEQDQQSTVTKVPLLGDIPYLGALFRQKSIDNQARELLIFITPKIVAEDVVVR